MRLFLSRLHFPITTLGPGRRAGVWFQGCSLRCPGCVSVDTWAPGRGATTVARVLEALSPWLGEADGVTVSGGEPFEQTEALETLLAGLRPALRPGADVLVYSGRAWEEIAPRVGAWPGLADALISDPFRAEAGQTRPWRGSDNQRLHALTPLGRARYGPWERADRASVPPALDVFFGDGEVWMAGIPAPGALELIRERLARAGFASATSQARAVPLVFA